MLTWVLLCIIGGCIFFTSVLGAFIVVLYQVRKEHSADTSASFPPVSETGPCHIGPVPTIPMPVQPNFLDTESKQNSPVGSILTMPTPTRFVPSTDNTTSSTVTCGSQFSEVSPWRPEDISVSVEPPQEKEPEVNDVIDTSPTTTSIHQKQMLDAFQVRKSELLASMLHDPQWSSSIGAHPHNMGCLETSSSGLTSPSSTDSLLEHCCHEIMENMDEVRSPTGPRQSHYPASLARVEQMDKIIPGSMQLPNRTGDKLFSCASCPGTLGRSSFGLRATTDRTLEGDKTPTTVNTSKVVTDGSVRPSSVRPSSVRPSSVRPSSVRPSTVRPSTVRPSPVPRQPPVRTKRDASVHLPAAATTTTRTRDVLQQRQRRSSHTGECSQSFSCTDSRIRCPSSIPSVRRTE